VIPVLVALLIFFAQVLAPGPLAPPQGEWVPGTGVEVFVTLLPDTLIVVVEVQYQDGRDAQVLPCFDESEFGPREPDDTSCYFNEGDPSVVIVDPLPVAGNTYVVRQFNDDTEITAVGRLTVWPSLLPMVGR
jgi:hypothetical protein